MAKGTERTGTDPGSRGPRIDRDAAGGGPQPTKPVRDDAPPAGTGETLCTHCGGSGMIGDEPCEQCGGTGLLGDRIG